MGGVVGNRLLKTLDLVDILTLHNGGSYPTPLHMGRLSDCSSPEPARSRHRPPRSNNALRILSRCGCNFVDYSIRRKNAREREMVAVSCA